MGNKNISLKSLEYKIYNTPGILNINPPIDIILIGIVSYVSEKKIIYEAVLNKEKTKVIIKLNNKEKINPGKIIEIYQIKIIELNDIKFFEIIKYSIKGTYNTSNLINLYKLSLNYKLVETVYVNSINEVKDKTKLISIDLFKDNDYFLDSQKKILNVNFGNFKYELENRKKYEFKNCLIEEQSIKIINISKITEFYKIKLEKKNYFDLKSCLDIKNGKIINFYSKIDSFSFENKTLYIKINNSKTISVEVSNKLIKKITINGLNYFKNFIKNGENKFVYSPTSFIYAEEKTIIQINSLDFQKNNLFNLIEINGKEYILNKKQISIELEHCPKVLFYGQKISLKSDKTQRNFIIYIYVGKTNLINAFINNNNKGYSYEFIYSSKDEKLIPKKKIINNYQIENDNFGCKNHIRYNIINCFKQNEVKTNKGKNLQIIYRIGNEKTCISCLKIKKFKCFKKDFIIEENFNFQLNSFLKIIVKILKII